MAHMMVGWHHLVTRGVGGGADGTQEGDCTKEEVLRKSCLGGWEWGGWLVLDGWRVVVVVVGTINQVQYERCASPSRDGEGEGLGKINQGSNHRDDLGDDPNLWTEGDQRNCFDLNWVEISNTKVVSCRDLYFPPLF